jgi:hypothetical protein
VIDIFDSVQFDFHLAYGADNFACMIMSEISRGVGCI